MKLNQQFPKSKHFRLQQLVDGVFAALHIDGGWAIGNAGFINLGDRTLIFDTFSNPRAAKDLQMAAETLTGLPVATVVNSHWHHDHTWGNQVFDANTEIDYTEITCQMFLDSKG